MATPARYLADEAQRKAKEYARDLAEKLELRVEELEKQVKLLMKAGAKL